MTSAFDSSPTAGPAPGEERISSQVRARAIRDHLFAKLDLTVYAVLDGASIKDLLAKSGEESVGTQEPLHVPLQADLRDYDHLEAVYQKDIRHGGLMVETTELPDLQEEIVVPILLPEPHGQIDCRATVLKLFDDPPGIALRLEEVELVRVRLAEILGSRPAL